MAKKINLLPLAGITFLTLAVLVVGATLLWNGKAEAAIQFRSPATTAGTGLATITFVDDARMPAINDTGATSNNVTITPPAGMQTNDFVVVYVAVRDTGVAQTINGVGIGGGNTGGQTWTAPLATQRQNNVNLRIFYTRFNGTWTAPDPSFTWATAESYQVWMVVFRGVDAVTPIDAGPSVAAFAAPAFPFDVTIAASTITTTTANAMVIASWHSLDNNTWGNLTAGWSNPNGQAYWRTSWGTDSSSSIGYRVQAAAGGNAAVTNRQTLNGGDAGIRSILALRPAPAITISMPGNTQQDDVMIASIGFRANPGGLPGDIDITPPTGWTQPPNGRWNNSNTTYNGLVVYYKVAGPSESSPYTWTFYCKASCASVGFQAATGGIASFSGVDTATPIDVENGQSTPAQTLDPATPPVNTNVANTMLVTSHTLANTGAYWQSPPPSGMTQAYQTFSGTQTIQVSYAIQASAGSVVAKTAHYTPGDAADHGNAHIFALRPICAVAVSEATYVAANAQPAQATVYWSSSNPALILRMSGSPVTDIPTNGTAYTVGTQPWGPSNSTVVYNGSVVETSFSQSSLTNATTYYYKVFAKSGTCYSPAGTEVNARPEAGPTPAWSYMMSNGSTMRAGIAGEGSLNSSGNFQRIISLNTANGTQMWAPVATNGAVQSWLTWLPNAYPYWASLTVTAGSAAVPTGYSVSVTINHASLVSAGKSKADGDDLRVFYWSGTAWVQLDRVLDVDSAWNSATTKIWFKTQAAIAASGTDSNYYLYYGNPNAGAPPANPNNVYIFYDDFSWSDAPSNHGWTVRNGTWAAASGVMTSSGSATAFDVMSHSAATTNAEIEARVRGRADVCADCRHTGVGLRFSSAGSGYVGIGYDYDSARLTLVGQTGWQTNNTLLGYIAQNLTADTWYRIKFQAIGTTLSDKAWQDGTMEPGWQLTLTDSTYASGTEITLFGGWDSPKHSEFDWVKVRSAVDPEPTVAPGTEQVATVGVVIGGDQTARVYSVDASTGGTNWTVNLTGSGAETIQAPVAAQLLAYSDATFKSTYSDDVLFVATRNSSTTNNKLFALRASDGAVLWSFNGTIGSYNVDYIVGMPWVDYARNRVYVVSRAGGGAQSSLWVINSLTGALVQSFALGHISASPTMSYDGATLYVGNEAGTLYAINLNTLAQKWSLAVGGALKGFVWEDWTTAGRLYFATGANQVRCVLDQTTSGSIQWTTAVTAPSTPLTMDTVLYVGSSDGKVHQLLLSNGTDQKQYTVGGGAYQVGDVSTETWNEIFVPTTEGKLYKLTLPLP